MQERTMAHFQLTDGTGIGAICLDSNPRPDGTQKKLTLDQWGWDEDANPHEIAFIDPSKIGVTVVANDRKKKITRFEVETKPRGGPGGDPRPPCRPAEERQAQRD
jgi:hypothetical protein